MKTRPGSAVVQALVQIRSQISRALTVLWTLTWPASSGSAATAARVGNWSGKSTLMNVLYGLYHPDGGEIRLNGKPVSFSSARDAIDAGIGMVHQHFMLIPVMTVAENVVLGTEPLRSGVFLDEPAAERRVADMAPAPPLSGGPQALLQDNNRGPQQPGEDMKGPFPDAQLPILHAPT